MITFREFISEIFNSHYEVDDESHEDGHHEYQFHTPKGHHYRINISPSLMDKNTGYVSFEKNNGGKWTAQHTDDVGSEAHRVLGTVTHIIKQHAIDHGVKELRFSGTGKPTTSRNRLYSRIGSKQGRYKSDFIHGNTHHSLQIEAWNRFGQVSAIYHVPTDTLYHGNGRQNHSHIMHHLLDHGILPEHEFETANVRFGYYDRGPNTINIVNKQYKPKTVIRTDPKEE